MSSTGVCVITVCWNALAALRTTVDSVRANKKPGGRYIVIDGGSTDSSVEYLRSNADIVDQWVSEPDGGIYDAMNKGISLCDDLSWVIFMNAGDTFHHPGVLDDLEGLLSPDRDVVMGGVALCEGERERLLLPQPLIRSKMPACHQGIFVRGSLLKRYRFDTALRVGADFEQYLRISAEIDADRIAFAPFAVARVAPEGFSARNERVLQRDYFAAIARHRGRPGAWRLLLER